MYVCMYVLITKNWPLITWGPYAAVRMQQQAKILNQVSLAKPAEAVSHLFFIGHHTFPKAQ